MNNIIEKINNSRYVLKDILTTEWNVSVIQDYSNQEIESMYSVPSAKINSINSLGNASACNLSIPHKYIPSVNLHIIYFNFPEIGKLNSKITKSACDKISNLYKSEMIQPEDSIFVIINDIISESLKKSFETLNITLQNEIEDIPLSESIQTEMKQSKHILEKRHFRNVQLFNINSLTRNILQHSLTYKHEPIRSKTEINKILETCNCKKNQLPIISKTDPVAKLLRIVPGDIAKITRNSKKCGEYPYYRLCK